MRSLTLFEKVGNKRGQSFVYNSLGNNYVKDGTMAEGEALLREITGVERRD
ncbi:MAG: hypothetical protein WDO15_23745 [Bacteroidota bacterium]